MKALLLSIMLCAVSSFVVAGEVEYKEGVHYDIIDAPASKKPEVREFFSFYCPHCHNYERLAKAVKPSLPDGTFTRNHVDSLSMAVNPDQVRLTRALAVLQQMSVADKEMGVSTLFDIIHRQRRKDLMGSETSVKTILATSGIDASEIERLWDAPETLKISEDMHAIQKDLFERELLQGVPSIVVNGKYLIKHEGLDKDNVIDDYAEIGRAHV